MLRLWELGGSTIMITCVKIWFGIYFRITYVKIMFYLGFRKKHVITLGNLADCLNRWCKYMCRNVFWEFNCKYVENYVLIVFF